MPEAAQKHRPTSYNGLVSLKVDNLGKKKGKNMLVSTSAARAGSTRTRSTCTFIDNGVSTAATISDDATAKCTK